jgi:hypothetical protein
MSTRSIIGRQSPDGKVTLIYCHSDGYITHNGRILHESYQSERKISQLLALGDISFLGPEIGEKHPFDCPHSMDFSEWMKTDEYAKRQSMVLAYHRDRGESKKQTKARVYESLEAIPKEVYEEFFYLWAEGRWVYSDHGNFTYLRELTAEFVKAEMDAEEKRFAEYKASRAKAAK